MYLAEYHIIILPIYRGSRRSLTQFIHHDSVALLRIPAALPVGDVLEGDPLEVGPRLQGGVLLCHLREEDGERGEKGGREGQKKRRLRRLEGKGEEKRKRGG